MLDKLYFLGVSSDCPFRNSSIPHIGYFIDFNMRKFIPEQKKQNKRLVYKI